METSSLSLLEPEDRYASKLRFELAGLDLTTQLAFFVSTDLSELGFLFRLKPKTKVDQKYFQNHA